MANAQARGWGHPDDAGYRQRNIVTVNAGGVRLPVHRGVARLFKGFVDELVAGGYPLDVVADDWGYVNRDIRGRPGVKSNHAWGLAVDLNATKNPMTEAHPGHAGTAGHDERGVHTDMPAWVGPLARRWGLTWGANYTGSRKDAMHFEFVGTPADVERYPLGGDSHIPSIEEEDVIPPIPIHVAPGESKSFHVEPTEPNGAGFLGTKDCLVVLSTHSAEPVQCWVWGQGDSPRGRVEVGRDPLTFKPENGWLHIRNEGRTEIGGNILYRR